ncbi:MAG: hypothetical protein JSS08_07745 [Proteobacteria bacterium]|nr:hypothetical protein [Pseudomonadota bacterium]
MKRRDLMTLLPVAVALASLPALAAAHESEDPIMPAYREWLAARPSGKS